VEPQSGEEKPHLPPPSLWPVGFAVGVVCILVGLIISWPAVAVGAAITLLFGFLWVRDVAADQRTVTLPPAPEQAEGGAEATTGAPALPANEGEAAMPEPEPGERFPRSVFLENTTLGLGALIGGIVTVPILGFAIAPVFTGDKHKEIDLGPISNFKEGEFVIATFTSNQAQGDVSRRTAYVRNNGVVGGNPSFTVISNRCAHLGCPVQANGPLFPQRHKVVKTGTGEVSLTPTLPAGGFGCPCHGGQYDTEGNRTAGPPVRGLDRYEFLIRDGRLVLGNTYSVANVEGSGKSARIKKYELQGPGQPVDGIESWMYPLQPPH
jgi:menaquinol-cytochrome c reductase iron-sulfur subunit